MKRVTIVDAAILVLKNAGRPLTAQEIFSEIKSKNLYQFMSEKGLGVLNTQLRRHSENLNFSASSKVRHFVADDAGRFKLK